MCDTAEKTRLKQTDNFFSPLIENKHVACKLRRLRKPGAPRPSGRRMKYSGALQGQSAYWLIIVKAARRLLHWDSCLHCATFYGHAAGCGLEVLFLTVCRDSLCLSNELRFWLSLARASGKGTVQCVGKGGNVTVWQACQTPSSFFHREKLSGLCFVCVCFFL